VAIDEKHLGKLAGKIALITGGNSGIGLAKAKRFVTEGVYVFITGRRKSELDAVIKEIKKNVTAIQEDVANLDDLDRLFAQINAVPLGRLGRPDEIANAVVFLASHDSRYITGTELFGGGGIAQV